MFPQTVRQRDYIFNCLGARGVCCLDVKGGEVEGLQMPI